MAQNAGLGRLRAGIQGWQDSFGQTLASSDWDFSVGGLSWARTFEASGDMDMQFGLFSLFEGQSNNADDAILMTLDLDWGQPGEHYFGFSVYYLSDDGAYSYPITLPGGGIFTYDSAWDVWVGVRGGTMLGRIPVSAFALYNNGQRDDIGATTFEHHGTALKFEAGRIPFRCGALSFQALYSTGDGNPDEQFRDGFRTVAQSARDNFGSQGYWSYLVITSPHGPSDVNDLGVGLQNRGLGLFTLQTKFDYPIYGRLSGTIAGGWLRSDASNPTSGGSEIGTELANIFTLNFGGGLSADLGASVLFTGDFYKTAPAVPRPDNLWEVFTRVQLDF